VIGRPITEPADGSPPNAARRIVDEMQKAFDSLP
jgi:hypothetical protein